MQNIVISGAAGAIGRAFVEELCVRYPGANVFALSQRGGQWPETVRHLPVRYQDEDSIQAAAREVQKCGRPDLVIVANGILHQGDIGPEKSLRDLSAEKMTALFQANTIFPALMAKHFLPLLPRDRRAVFAALSARVGSISDNHLGGWYSYRASKAALNMIVRTAAIEARRRCPDAIVVGLHPGTVASALSEPFQAGVPEGKLFTPQYSVSCLLEVIDGLQPGDSGDCFDWQGKRIEP